MNFQLKTWESIKNYGVKRLVNEFPNKKKLNQTRLGRIYNADYELPHTRTRSDIFTFKNKKVQLTLTTRAMLSQASSGLSKNSEAST